ncbi:hypothetical protein [Microcystis phage Mwe-JY25]
MSALPILCLDFDGVIHSYTSGWQGAAVVADSPVPGALKFLERAVERFDVQILSSRSGQPGGVEAMRAWLRMWLVWSGMRTSDVERLMSRIGWPTTKPPALVTIDDRALTFMGEWPSIDEIASFKPWNKLAPAERAPLAKRGMDVFGLVDGAGLEFSEFAAALSAWVFLQHTSPTVRAAADAFNVTDEVIRLAVAERYWLFLDGPEDDPDRQTIEQEGE